MEKIAEDRSNLLKWYHKNKRVLPWRSSKNPYLVWISEVMLQQTTVKAVVPYYERFTARFPTLESLATAPIEDVLANWAGLGYYSRARNLHKAAQKLHQIVTQTGRFPQSYTELIELPGFGPYTARAVSSICFSEKTGVLDGNVIRVLCRKYGYDFDWWKTENKNFLQNLSDQLAQTKEVSDLNQALMELGATVCTPQKTLCPLCPWVKTCVSVKKKMVQEIPKKKTPPKKEIWFWNFDVYVSQKSQKESIYLVPNTKTPFLSNNWLPPSKAVQKKDKPKKFQFRHAVTKYDIFVQLNVIRQKSSPSLEGQWVDLKEIKKVNPTSLIDKIIKHI